MEGRGLEFLPRPVMIGRRGALGEEAAHAVIRWVRGGASAGSPPGSALVLLPSADEAVACSQHLKEARGNGADGSFEGVDALRVVEVLGPTHRAGQSAALNAMRRLGSTAVLVVVGGIDAITHWLDPGGIGCLIDGCRDEITREIAISGSEQDSSGILPRRELVLAGRAEIRARAAAVCGVIGRE